MDDFVTFIIGAIALAAVLIGCVTVSSIATDARIADAIAEGTPPLHARCAFRDSYDCKLLYVRQEQQ